MSKSKSKTYYIHDIANEMVIPSLDLDEAIDVIMMHFLSEKAEWEIFEYGLLEQRGAGYKLSAQYSVKSKFKIEKDKMTYVG